MSAPFDAQRKKSVRVGAAHAPYLLLYHFVRPMETNYLTNSPSIRAKNSMKFIFSERVFDALSIHDSFSLSVKPPDAVLMNRADLEYCHLFRPPISCCTNLEGTQSMLANS